MPAYYFDIDGAEETNVLNMVCKSSVLDRVGTFEVDLENINGRRSSLFTMFDEARIYFGSGDTTSKVFTGRVEEIHPIIKPTSQERLILRGSDYTARLVDAKNVIEDLVDHEVSNIVGHLIATYASDLSTNNVELTPMTLNRWTATGKTLYGCMKDLGYISSYDFYVDGDKDLHWFESAPTASDIILSSKTNILDFDFPTEARQMANRIYVYGDTGVATVSEDASSITTYGVVEKKIVDKTIQSVEAADDRANAELSRYGSPYQYGTLKVFLNEEIQAGNLVKLTLDEIGVSGTEYAVIDVEHRLDEFVTNVTVARFTEEMEHHWSDVLRRLELLEGTVMDTDAMQISFQTLYEKKTMEAKVTVEQSSVNHTFIRGHSDNGVRGRNTASNTWTTQAQFDAGTKSTVDTSTVADSVILDTSASTYLSDDFEDAIDSWTVSAGTVDEQSITVVHGGSQSMEMTNNGGNADVNRDLDVNSSADGDTFDWWTYSNAVDSWFIHDGSTRVAGLTRGGAGDAAKWGYLDGDSPFWHNTTQAWASNTWEHIRFVFDYTNHTYDLYINDMVTPIAASKNFRNNQNQITNIQIRMDAAGTNYVDDVDCTSAGGYDPLGWWTSADYDAGTDSQTGDLLSWTSTEPANTDIDWYVAYGDTAAPANWTSVGSVDPVSPIQLGSYNGRYWRVRAELNTSDNGETPQLNDVTISVLDASQLSRGNFMGAYSSVVDTGWG